MLPSSMGEVNSIVFLFVSFILQVTICWWGRQTWGNWWTGQVKENIWKGAIGSCFPQICFNRRWHLTAHFFVGACCRLHYCGFWKVLCTAAWANSRATFFYTVTSLFCFTGSFPPSERLLLIVIIFTGVIRSRVPTSFRRFFWKQTMFTYSAVRSLYLLWQTLAVMSRIEVILNCDWHDKFVWWNVEVIP